MVLSQCKCGALLKVSLVNWVCVCVSVKVCVCVSVFGFWLNIDVNCFGNEIHFGMEKNEYLQVELNDGLLWMFFRLLLKNKYNEILALSNRLSVNADKWLLSWNEYIRWMCGLKSWVDEKYETKCDLVQDAKLNEFYIFFFHWSMCNKKWWIPNAKSTHSRISYENRFVLTLLGAVWSPWNGRFSYSPGSVNRSPPSDDLPRATSK